jgi:serine/threonine-protein kinase HipA
MNMCPGCYRTDHDGYCPACRRELFDGAKVSVTLPFDMPIGDNLPVFQEQTKCLSISGVQLKYSLRLEGRELQLTEKGGEYILKPYPLGQILRPEITPENEHLTMQIAAQVFGIPTAPSGLIYFKDGAAAYLTRRFDRREDGSKSLQEDMTQLSRRSRQSHGENFKYYGTCSDIGALIKQYVAASMPALENFFRIVIFNYLFANGDAHLKNFSLIRTAMGDYTLSPAYDLLNTGLHSPNESDTALSLYEGDIDSSFYSTYGYYGQENFRELGKRLGLLPRRVKRILTFMCSRSMGVEAMIGDSFFSHDIKDLYVGSYRERIKRMGMTEEMISRTINAPFPGVYAVTTTPTSLHFRDGKQMVGYFQPTGNSDALLADNKYTFIEMSNSAAYRNHPDDQYVTLVDGDLLLDVVQG